MKYATFELRLKSFAELIFTKMRGFTKLALRSADFHNMLKFAAKIAVLRYKYQYISMILKNGLASTLVKFKSTSYKYINFFLPRPHELVAIKFNQTSGRITYEISF